MNSNLIWGDSNAEKIEHIFRKYCYHQTVKEYKSNGSLIRSKTDYYQAIGGSVTPLVRKGLKMDFLKQKGPLAREFCNTLIYIISLVSLKPSSLQRVLTELQWNGMWFFSLAFFAVIFMEMLSDFLLVTDRCTAWKALNGNVSEAEFHNLQQIVLCENQKVSIEKKLASTILLVLMICATAAFVWFTFLV